MTDMEKKHLALLRSHLAECTVLLKTNGDFPLEAPCRIAAYGSGVRKTVKGGTGSGEVNSRFFVNVEQGLENASFTLTTKKWLDAYDEMYVQARKVFIKQLKAEARTAHANAIMYGMGKTMPEPDYDLPLDGEGEVAVYVLSRISGEGNDRSAAPGDVFMPGCKADYKNILKGLSAGQLTRKQLQINATRIYRMAKKLNEQ